MGGVAIDKVGRPDPDETFVKANAADAVLMGSVGGPKWDGLPFEKRAERGLRGAPLGGLSLGPGRELLVVAGADELGGPQHELLLLGRPLAQRASQQE